MKCSFCEKEITDQRRAWRESVGWVSPDGAKAMTLSHQTGALAHPECIVSAKAGVHVDQQTLDA
jgi:hypothetical protein